MSKKKNTTNPPPETAVPAPQRHSQPGPVPELRNDTTRALWAALRANPDRTTAALAHIAGIGQSTARRLLAGWETAGCAQSRTESDNPRAPKIWNTSVGAPATTEPNPAPAEPETTEPPTPEPVSPEPVTSADTAPAEPETTEPPTPEPVSPEPATPADPAPVTPAANPPQQETVPGSDVPADPEPDTTVQTAAAGPTGDDPTDQPPVAPTPPAEPAAADAESTGQRLPAGALRGQVEDYLRDNPGKEFTPHQIGKALDRSSGAVHNALVTLTKAETARQTSTAPKKFTLAS